jgi:hypothetical protein
MEPLPGYAASDRARAFPRAGDFDIYATKKIAMMPKVVAAAALGLVPALLFGLLPGVGLVLGSSCLLPGVGLVLGLGVLPAGLLMGGDVGG